MDMQPLCGFAFVNERRRRCCWDDPKLGPTIRTTAETPFELYQFNCLPFGLSSAPWI